jgi:hypothetical protein
MSRRSYPYRESGIPFRVVKKHNVHLSFYYRSSNTFFEEKELIYEDKVYFNAFILELRA